MPAFAISELAIYNMDTSVCASRQDGVGERRLPDCSTELPHFIHHGRRRRLVALRWNLRLSNLSRRRSASWCLDMREETIAGPLECAVRQNLHGYDAGRWHVQARDAAKPNVVRYSGTRCIACIFDRCGVCMYHRCPGMRKEPHPRRACAMIFTRNKARE